jgi:DNA-binding MarR family transcriptional regulator
MNHKNCDQISRTVVLVTRLFKFVKFDLEHRMTRSNIKLTLFQYGALQLISRGHTTINEMARIMVVKPPSLVSAIDLLEKEKLVQRKVDPKDRRKTPLYITKRGADLLQKIPHISESDAIVKGIKKMGKRSEILFELLDELVKNTETVKKSDNN